MTPQTYIFYGPTNSGKGTQALLLKEYLEKNDSEHKVLYIETGAFFREFAQKDNYTSKLTKDIIEKGGLMPEFLPIWLWADFLVKNYTGNEHCIFDGLARRVEEAPILDKALRFYKKENVVVLSLNVSHEHSIARSLGRGRSDDEEEKVKKKFDWYDNNVVPTIEFFRNNPDYTFFDINGEQTIEEVHRDIVLKLQNTSTK